MDSSDKDKKELVRLAAEALVSVERLVVYCRHHNLELEHAYILLRALRQLEEEYKEKGIFPARKKKPP